MSKLMINETFDFQKSQFGNPYSRAFYLKALLAFATFGQSSSAHSTSKGSIENSTMITRTNITAKPQQNINLDQYIKNFKSKNPSQGDDEIIKIDSDLDSILVKTDKNKLLSESSSDSLRYLAEYIQATLIESKYGSRPSFSETAQPTPTDFHIAIESLSDAISFYKLSAQKLIQENKIDRAIDDYLNILSIKNEISYFDSQITGKINQPIQIPITADNAIKELVKDHRDILKPAMIDNSPMLLDYFRRNPSPQPSTNIKTQSSQQQFKAKSSQREL